VDVRKFTDFVCSLLRSVLGFKCKYFLERLLKPVKTLLHSILFDCDIMMVTVDSGGVVKYTFRAPVIMANRGNGGRALGILARRTARRKIGDPLFILVLIWIETWRSPTEVKFQ